MKESIGRVAIGFLEGAARALGNYIADKAIDKWESRGRLERSPAACCKCGRERVCPMCGVDEGRAP
jgi:hypothetical protein